MRAFIFLLALVSSTMAEAGDRGVPPLKRVMTIVFENANYSKALQQPYLKSLVARGALLKSYYGLARPSQPNYIALTSGDTYNVQTDSNVNLNVRHIGDLLEEHGLTWKVYAQGYPEGGCFLGKSKGQYMRKHNPFVSYRSIQNDPDRCARIIPADRLDDDILLDKLPNYALYIPDDNNNGHDTGVAFADKWLKREFDPLFSSRAFMDGMLVAITFDEGGIGGQHIYTLLLGDQVKPGSSVDTKLDHYSLIRTIEDGFGLGTLGRKDATAVAISGVWK